MTKHHSCWGCKTKLAMFYTWCDFVFLNHLTLVNIVKEESTLNWLRATTCHHFIHLLFRFICTVICNLKNKQNVKKKKISVAHSLVILRCIPPLSIYLQYESYIRSQCYRRLTDSTGESPHQQITENRWRKS